MARVLQALGGRANIADLQHRGSRLCMSVRDPAAVDESALANRNGQCGARRRPSRAGSIHLVVGPAAATWFAEMKPS